MPREDVRAIGGMGAVLMRGVLLTGPGGVVLDDLPAPDVEGEDVLVRVRAAAVCATDRKAVASGVLAPRVLGHEAAGILPDGTPVGIHPEVSCGTCTWCLSQRENRCSDRVSIGLGRDGGFAELVAVPPGRLLPLGDLGPELAPLLEPLACCVHALDLLDLRPGDVGLVVGAGAMGILTMWAMQAAGLRVVVSQRSEPRRTMALQLGADAVVGTGEDPTSALGEPPRVAVVTAPGGPPVQGALESVAVGGVVHALAGTSGDAPVNANTIHYRHVSLIGSTGSTFDAYRRAHELAVSGAVPLQRLPVERIPLEDLPGALRTAPAPTVLKTLVDIERG